MPEMPWLPKLKVAPRIGIAILLTVGAAYLLDQALRTLIPPPPFLVIQREWLVNSVAAGTRIASDVPGRDARSAFAHLPASRFFDFTVSPVRPATHGESDSRLGENIRTMIAERLGLAADNIIMTSAVYDQNSMERNARTAVVIIPELPAMLTAQSLASRESIVLGKLTISVRLANNYWLTLAQKDLTPPWRHYARYGMGIVGYLLIAILFSMWMARSIVAPLTRLAAAAEQLGRSHQPTLITGMRIPEFVSIADTFNTMQLRLKTFIDERMSMLAAISHDLRTPLTRLRLMAEYADNQEQRELLLLNVAEMETMVGDVLAFMGATARGEPIETVDVAALLISLTDEFADLGEKVVYRGPEHADRPCRPVALKRAFSNLVANGCKYGGAVQIVLAMDGSALVVEIRDRGPGIPPEQIERAFRPFERLETSRSRATGGSGLGLTIAREIIRGHAGEIDFLWPETGFIVQVRLPLSAF